MRAFEPVATAGRGADAASRLVAGGAYLITDGVHGGGAALAELLLRTLGARVALVVPPQFPPAEPGKGGRAAGGAAGGRRSAPR